MDLSFDFEFLLLFVFESENKFRLIFFLLLCVCVLLSCVLENAFVARASRKHKTGRASALTVFVERARRCRFELALARRFLVFA